MPVLPARSALSALSALVEGRRAGFASGTARPSRERRSAAYGQDRIADPARAGEVGEQQGPLMPPAAVPRA
ncbi:hypothetical protein ACWC2T_16740 [Streptomyces sp. NPDC001393]